MRLWNVEVCWRLKQICQWLYALIYACLARNLWEHRFELHVCYEHCYEVDHKPPWHLDASAKHAFLPNVVYRTIHFEFVVIDSAFYEVSDVPQKASDLVGRTYGASSDQTCF